MDWHPVGSSESASLKIGEISHLLCPGTVSLMGHGLCVLDVVGVSDHWVSIKVTCLTCNPSCHPWVPPQSRHTHTQQSWGRLSNFWQVFCNPWIHRQSGRQGIFNDYLLVSCHFLSTSCQKASRNICFSGFRYEAQQAIFYQILQAAAHIYVSEIGHPILIRAANCDNKWSGIC